MKRCTACKQPRDPDTDFWRDNSRRDGLQPACKQCQNRQRTASRRRHRGRCHEAELVPSQFRSWANPKEAA